MKLMDSSDAPDVRQRLMRAPTASMLSFLLVMLAFILKVVSIVRWWSLPYFYVLVFQLVCVCVCVCVCVGLSLYLTYCWLQFSRFWLACGGMAISTGHTSCPLHQMFHTHHINPKMNRCWLETCTSCAFKVVISNFVLALEIPAHMVGVWSPVMHQPMQCLYLLFLCTSHTRRFYRCIYYSNWRV